MPLIHRRLFPAHSMFAVLAALATLLFVVSACASSTVATSPTVVPAKGTVNVAYAGSLTNLMEHKIAAPFRSATGYTFQGKGAGSTALANQISGKLIQPDVFISASTGAYKTLQGDANGNIVRWYLSFASTQMVIGYSPKSQFAAQFQAAASGTTPWYSVLQSPGLRLGRTDPALDPKGVNTIYTMQLAENFYHQPGLSQKILGADTNTSQIFPEEDLVARLSSGQLDAGFFYLNEVKDAGLPYITLPAQINLGDPAQKAAYAQAHYTAAGKTSSGAPILYSLTIPATVKDQAGAVAFVQFLLGSQGQGILQADGIGKIPYAVGGDASALPATLQLYAHS